MRRWIPKTFPMETGSHKGNGAGSQLMDDLTAEYLQNPLWVGTGVQSLKQRRWTGNSVLFYDGARAPINQLFIVQFSTICFPILIDFPPLLRHS